MPNPLRTHLVRLVRMVVCVREQGFKLRRGDAALFCTRAGMRWHTIVTVRSANERSFAERTATKTSVLNESGLIPDLD